MAFEVVHELEGWALAWARLAVRGDAGTAREAYAARARGYSVEEPAIAAVRRLFRAAGTDPTRYRPSSEALLRRLGKGEPLPAIHPLVDLNNCLSVALRVPSCIMAAESIRPPVVLRAGRPGERMDSLRGEFDLAGKPLLADGSGPFGTPITDSRRVAVEAGTREGWLVAYLPKDVVEPGAVEAELRGPLSAIAEVVEWFAT